MSEKLTESELIILAERKYDVEFIGERAVAQIRELDGRFIGLRDENAKLREYVRHNAECVVGTRQPCTCGLDAVLKEASEPAGKPHGAWYCGNCDAKRKS